MNNTSFDEKTREKKILNENINKWEKNDQILFDNDRLESLNESPKTVIERTQK